MRDETYDYGLASGESFEPVDDADDWFDLSQPHIRTVLGPIDPDDLGVAVYIRPTTSEQLNWSRNPAQTVAALEDAYNVGLRAVIIIDPIDDELEQSDLNWIAGRSPVHLVVASSSTGIGTFGRRSEADVIRDTFVVLRVENNGDVPTEPDDIANLDHLLLAFPSNPLVWAELIERAPISLMERGLDAPTVRRILVDNPATALTIRP